VALETLVSFLASVYLVRKKSVHSFVTALVGAVSNIILNSCFIPIMGALGAAVATLASFAIVLILRMIDAKRIIPFDFCLPRLCISMALLFGAAAITTLDVTGRIWWTLLCTLATCAINAPALLKGLRAIVAKRLK
jgi:O-antigen/teichoic acid export membrane protein